MWCTQCNIETNDTVCPICGVTTIEDLPVEVYWCNNCCVPVIQTTNQADKGICPICGRTTKYLAADLRPVFPEERILLESLLGMEHDTLLKKSIWANNNRYYIDGKSMTLPNSIYQITDTSKITEELYKRQNEVTYSFFDDNIKDFVFANSARLNYIKDEAYAFIQKEASKFPEENIVVSFSGGKDSTVTADLAVKALSNPSLVHIFGDTTLEFPSTIEYAHRFRDAHPDAIFQIAKNDEQNFYDVCEDIGPPARMMRWCCSMFKTGPITRIINSLYRSQQILTFYGIRKSESVSRSKYNRIEDSSDSVKIQQQTVASPIFFWKDIDIWLYASLWILQNISREQSTQRPLVYYPVHKKEGYFTAYPLLKQNDCIGCDKLIECPKALDIIKTRLGCDDEDAEDIIEQMIPDERYEALYLNECEEQSCEDTDVILAAIARETISDGEEVFESVFDAIRKEYVAEQLMRLKPREREVLKKRFGFEGPAQTLEEVGQNMNVTRERIRQIEAKAIRRLRHPTYSLKLEDFI